ncbi:B-cell lymphoma 3 protein [Madurella fahalii]|uniref:B-cell lymphoma 3 protein n=1 Tax=Madurella fahalii TaxID=1157608 RepID=A0ABQ0GDC6_9PEZI
MDSSDTVLRRQRQGLRLVIRTLFRNPKAQSGPQPAPLSHADTGEEHMPLRQSGRAEKAEEQPNIHAAVRNGDLEAVQKALRAVPEALTATNDQGMTPLSLAVLHGNLAIAKHLVSAGASVLPADNNGESLMCFAATTQQAAIIRWLALQHDGKLTNARDLAGNTALHHAVCRDGVHVVRILLERGADPNLQALPPPSDPNSNSNSDDNTNRGLGTPLSYAVVTARASKSPATCLDIVRLLLNHGARPDLARECDGASPIHEAAAGGLHAVLAALLDDGRRPGMVDLGSPDPRDGLMRGTTPLMYAAGQAGGETVGFLLSRGADPARINELGETVLHWAVVNDNEAEAVAAIRLLVGRPGGKELVNVRHRYGGTALHGAAYKGKMESVRTLLRLGADWTLVASDHHYGKLLGLGGTAEELARGQGHWEVAEYLAHWAESGGCEQGEEGGKEAEDGVDEKGNGEDGEEGGARL